MKKKRRTKISKFPVRKINKKIERKLVGLFLLVMLALVALTVKITQINAANGDEYKRIVLQNTQQQYINRTLAFKRGDILDRNGTILATSERVYNLILDCQVVNYEEEDEDGNTIRPYREITIDAIVKFFGCKRSDIEAKLDGETTKNSQYQIIKKNVTMDEKEAYEAYINEYTDKNADSNEKLTDKQLAEKRERARINGIWLEETYKRVYPQNSLACDVIGFCNSSNEATWGIEGYYSDILNGVDGRAFGYFNSDSDVEQTIIQAEDGNNIVSTIDVNIQQIIRTAITDFQERYADGPNGTNGAKNIAVLVMDPNNGEILGMDSTDWYDLNDPQNMSGIVDDAQWAAMTDEEKVVKMNEVWRNYCISDAFEPGSTAKPMTVAAALATDSVEKTDIWDCDGYQIINGLMIRCSEYPNYHGEQDTEYAIVNSCNDALMQIADKLGVENFLKYQSIFNLGTKTGIDLPGENAGILYTEDTMGTVELATSSFGQGFTCTMIQEASAIASLINGGYYYKPHTVKSITDSSGNLLENKSSVVERQTVSKDVSDFIREAMGETVASGTGRSAKVPGYNMGGKTGTAQKIPRDSGNYLVSFLGFAPLDDPQVLVYVVVDEPNVEKQDTSAYAQEISKQIFTELLPYMNIFMDNPEEKAEYEAEQARLKAEAEAAEQARLEQEAAEEAYRQYLAELEAQEQAAREAEIAAQQAELQRQRDELQQQLDLIQQQLQAGTEQGISDTTVPLPQESSGDETVIYGGNDIYSDGVENDAY